MVFHDDRLVIPGVKYRGVGELVFWSGGGVPA